MSKALIVLILFSSQVYASTYTAYCPNVNFAGVTLNETDSRLMFPWKKDGKDLYLPADCAVKED